MHYKKTKEDSIILMRVVSNEEFTKFVNNTLEVSEKKWYNDSEGVGYCYAIDATPEELKANFSGEKLLVLEVSPKLFASCKRYFGRNYFTRYNNGETGTRSWDECSREVPFVAETCRSFSVIDMSDIEDIRH